MSHSLAESADCLCLASRKAARAITRAFEKELRPYGLRATQFSVLAVLTVAGPKSIGVLARMLGTDRTTLTRNLARLEDRSLIESGPDGDARTRIVAATSKGRATLTRAFPAWRKAQAAMSASIGREAAESLRRLARSPRL